MHVGHTAIFQNPNQAVSDYQIYQEDMAIAKECADLGFQSVGGIEHHFTDYIMNPNITQFLSYMAGYNPNIKVGSMVVVMPELHKLGNEPLFDTEEAAPPAFMAA